MKNSLFCPSARKMTFSSRFAVGNRPFQCETWKVCFCEGLLWHSTENTCQEEFYFCLNAKYHFLSLRVKSNIFPPLCGQEWHILIQNLESRFAWMWVYYDIWKTILFRKNVGFAGTQILFSVPAGKNDIFLPFCGREWYISMHNPNAKYHFLSQRAKSDIFLPLCGREWYISMQNMKSMFWKM